MKKSLLRTAIAAAALVSLGAAQATVITFDEAIDTTFAPFAPLMGHLDEIQTQGFWIDTFSTKAGALPGDLVGALIDGAQQAVICGGFLVCPVNNPTGYLAALNDGLPDIGRLDGNAFKFTQFDGSFIAAAGDVVLATSILVRVEGYSGASLAYAQDFFMPGPANGNYTFATYALNAANAGTYVTEVAFRGFACTTSTTCSRSLDKAQFALDNLNVVPEPASWALVALGLIGSAAATRRRGSAA